MLLVIRCVIASIQFSTAGLVEPDGGKETKALRIASEVNLIFMSIRMSLAFSDEVRSCDKTEDVHDKW